MHAALVEVEQRANAEENRLFLDDAAGAGRARGSLETAGAALTLHTRPVLKVSERLTLSCFNPCSLDLESDY